MKLKIPSSDLRPYQVPFFAAMQGGCKEAALVQSRRSGKDFVSHAWTSYAALNRKGSYWVLMPQQNQIRKAFWNGIDANTGERILDIHYPQAIRTKTLSQEMLIELVNGSTIQFLGSDQPDALVGSGVCGVTISEGAISNPNAINYISPMLAENDGWLVVNSTPRGKNWFYDYFMELQADPGAYTCILTADDCGHISPHILERERRRKSKGLFLQEYFCSFAHGMEGSVYLQEMADVDSSGRICSVPHDPSLQVHTAWDIGYDDKTAVVWFQVGLGGDIRVIDYVEDSGEQPAYYLSMIDSREYIYGTHFLPHDGGHNRFGMESVSKQFSDLGYNNYVLPRVPNLQPALESTRVQLSKTVFDIDKTKPLVAALNAYRYEYDDKMGRFKQKPLHDWASDGADCFRYVAQAVKMGLCSTGGWGAPLDYSEIDKGNVW